MLSNIGLVEINRIKPPKLTKLSWLTLTKNPNTLFSCLKFMIIKCI